MKKTVLNNNKCKTNNTNEILPQKEFKARNSLLTDLHEIDQFKGVQNYFVSVIILVLMNMLICDILGTDSARYGFRYILIGFGQFDYVIIIWVVMFLNTLAVYPVFCVWSIIRMKLKPKSFFLKLWDRVWLLIFIVYFCLFLYVIPYTKDNKLPIASSVVVLEEQIRFLMKTHAFVRSNVPRVLSFKAHSDKKKPIPEFSKYFYFLFIPTLIYKDKYPRTKKIRWSSVAINLLKFVLGLFFCCFIAGNYFAPEFRNFGLEPYTLKTITISAFRTILPASVFMLNCFYLVLHVWMNLWAELLCFGDRLFYMDWWNAETYAEYYRKWNIIVHDYLHLYIYRDMYKIVVPGNKVVAKCSVILISALVHEYIICFMLGFFFPVMLVQFATLGMYLSFIKLKDQSFIGNTFLWWSLSTGIGIQFTLYAMEYYARSNCPKENETFTDFFIPRILSCYLH